MPNNFLTKPISPFDGPPTNVTLAQPINDAQVISLVAAQFPHLEPALAVERAIEIIAEACARGPMLKKRIEEALRALTDNHI